MKQILKKIGVIIVGASILSQISGCISDMTQTAEKKLEEKYNRTFEVLEVGKFGEGDAYNLICSQDGIKFTAEMSQDGSYFTDKYREGLMEKDLTEKMSEELEKVSDDFVIGMEVFGGAGDYTEGNLTEALSANPLLKFDIRVAFNDDSELNTEPEELYSALEKAFSAEKINGSAVIAFVDSEDMLEIKNILNDNPDIDSSVDEAMEQGVTLRTRITDGIMDLTREQLEDKLY